MKRQERMDDMWIMGNLVASALDATVCNMIPFVKRRSKGKYPKEPMRIIPKTEEEKREEEDRALSAFVGFGNSMIEKSENSKQKLV